MECDRHDFLQHIYGMLFGGRLIFSPIPENPQRILDIGTGTGRSFLSPLDSVFLTAAAGIWAINIAESVNASCNDCLFNR